MKSKGSRIVDFTPTQPNRIDDVQPTKEEIAEEKKEIAEDLNEKLKSHEEGKKNFNDKELLLHIHSELNKKHLGDHKLKMTHFIVCCTAYLKPSELHKSMAIKANRSEGKDNLAKATTSMFPEEDVLFLTNATVAALEDSINKWKIIIHSEVNLQKDDKGANAHLVEVIKQLTEGGTSTLKKDLLTGFKTTKESKQEQKTVSYGTTETADDDELSTRFIIGSMSGSPEKIKSVNKNTCDWFAGRKERKISYEWFAYGVKEVLTRTEVVIPFLDKLPDNFFDCHDARSMRDVKRFLSCVSAIAWLYQSQRNIDDENRIVAIPFDFLSAMIITGDFFNHTYSGLGDQRLQKCMDSINKIVDSRPELNDNTFSRLELQKEMGVTKNTIKGYLKGVSNLSIVRFHSKDGNNIIYERCQKGVNRVLMGVNWRELLEYFNGCQGVKISKNVLYLLEKLEKTLHEGVKDNVSEKIDPLKLTPSYLKELRDYDDLYPVEQFVAKYGEETLKEAKKQAILFEPVNGKLKILE